MITTLYPIFQRWSQKGSIYIISDTHFEDEDCLLMDKHWPTPEEHLKNFSKLTKNDTLIHLGDVGNPHWIAKLPGYKVLIMGNHDTAKCLYERKVREFGYDFPTIKDAKAALKEGIITSFTRDDDNDVYKALVDNKLFDEVYTGPLMIAEKIILSHEPVTVEWAYNIHGHDHSPNNKGDKFHLNCTSNVVSYKMMNLKSIIQSGCLKDVSSLHRITIDTASAKNGIKKEV